MFVSLLYLIYIAVSIFYLFCGVILLLRPQLLLPRIKALFPLLESFKYSIITSSLILIFIGLGLLVISRAIGEQNVFGLFLAIVLSTLEVYLGFKFYYFEQRDLPQAIIHVALHAVLVTLIVVFVLQHASSEINELQTQTAALFNALLP